MTMTRPCLLMILHLSQIFFTDGLTFNVSHHAFLCFFLAFESVPASLRAPGDPALREIVDRNLDLYVISREDPDIILAEFARYVGKHRVSVGQLYFEQRVGQSLDDRALEFDNIVFRQSNHPIL